MLGHTASNLIFFAIYNPFECACLLPFWLDFIVLYFVQIFFINYHFLSYPVESNGACEGAPVVSLASLKRFDEIESQVFAKTLEINEQRAQLGSLELDFRAQIQKVEQQLQELIALKRVQVSLVIF